MNQLRISLVAAAIFLLSGLCEASAQEVSYYYHPKNGQKSARFKPYIDSTAKSKPVRFEVVMVGRPADSLSAPARPAAPVAPAQPAKPEVQRPAAPEEQPAKPVEN